MEKINCTTCGTDNPANYKYCFSCGYELPKIKTENIDKVIQPPTRQKNTTGKKIVLLAVYAIAFGLSYFVIQQLFFKVPYLDRKMMEVASEVNKTCPLMVDAETRLDNAIALPKNVFQYNYTLINVEKANANPEEMKNYLEPVITNLVKTNPQMKPMRDLRTTFNYYYKDKGGNFLFLISLTPDKYE